MTLFDAAMLPETELLGDASAAPQGRATAASPADGESQGCPSPLGWREVLENFRAQSTPWQTASCGIPLRGRTFGTGAPLYFLNGFAGTSELFCLLAWLLRDEFRSVALEYPLVAEMPRRRRRLTAENLAADLFAAADLHGDATFPVFATSFGCAVALAALYTEPKRVSQAILLGGFARRQLSKAERFLCMMGGFLPAKMSAVPFREVIQRANHERYVPPFDPTRLEFFLRDAGQTPIRDFARRAAMFRTFDYRDRLPEIRQPVLLVRTEHEGHISAGCHDQLERGLPHAHCEMLASTGPLAHVTHPHRLAKSIRTLLAEDALSPPTADVVREPDLSPCCNPE